MDDKKYKNDNHDTSHLNGQMQGVDKAPGEDQGKEEKVTKEDLKGKKVDGDPSKESDKPSR
jgi:hypothetical protein